MTHDSVDINESFAALLDNYPTSDAELMAFLEKTALFAPLAAVEMPAAADLSADRQDFLDEVTYYQRKTAVALPPTRNAGQRLQAWLAATMSWNRLFSRKETHTMTPLLAKLAIIIALVMGIAGTTAVAASNSLPDSPLYTVKLALEEAELTFNTDENAEAELHLQRAETRIDEIEQMAIENRAAGDETLTRLQTHLTTAMQLAAAMPEANMNGILLRAQQMVQSRTRTMRQAQDNAPETQPQLNGAYQLMHQFGMEVEEGLADPVTFRQRYMNNRPDTAPAPRQNEPFGPNRPITPTQQLRPGPNIDCINGDCPSAGNAQQQQAPPDGYPGVGNCADSIPCEPINNANQYGDSDDAPPHGNTYGAEDNPAGPMEQNRPVTVPPDAGSGGAGAEDHACPNGNCDTPPNPQGKNKSHSEPKQVGSNDMACIELSCVTEPNQARSKQ